MNFGSLHPRDGYANFDAVHPVAPTTARIVNGLSACCCR
jgi:hypothetical protein